MRFPLIGVYAAGDTGNPIQVLAAASGANAAYFVNHDLAMEEADAAISATGGERGTAARQSGLTRAELVRSWM